jgi:hypothetical protein
VKKNLRIGLLSLFLLITASGNRAALAQNEGDVFFPETGHWVTGDFLAAYEGLPNPLEIYGFPITDAYSDASTGREVQYFQKARFVLDPQASGPLRVQLSPLGELLYEPGTALPHSPSFPACRRFDETGYEICYAFLDFFEANGGVAQFGYPISNFESQGGRIVQYFQRARFEWRPDLPPGQRVLLGDLGVEYFQAAGEDASRLLPDIENNLPQSIIELRVSAFPTQAVMPFGGTQTVFIIVEDQNLRPVADVDLELELRLPSGEIERYGLPSSDENGLSQTSFPVDASAPGVAEIEVSARFDSFQEETLTSFRIWW